VSGGGSLRRLEQGLALLKPAAAARIRADYAGALQDLDDEDAAAQFALDAINRDDFVTAEAMEKFYREDVVDTFRKHGRAKVAKRVRDQRARARAGGAR
jgi:ABC-type Zn uptake system ZnuABC Zn-binding protein ZnuA